MTLKPLPHDIQAEIAILGGMLFDNDCIFKVRKIIFPSDFYRESHENICSAIFDLREKADIVTVAEWLEKGRLLEKCGGYDYLAWLVESVITSAGIKHHSEIIKELSKRRGVIAACSSAAEKAYGVFNDIDTVLSEHKSDIRRIESGQQSKIPSNKEILMSIMDDLEKGGDDHTVGVLTGLKNIDAHLNGLEPKTTYCVIAESGTAKSALALNISDYVALHYPGKVPYFTLESTSTALIRRRLAKHTNIALTRLRNRNIRGDWEWENLTNACNTLSEPNLMIIDDTFYQTIENLTAFCESMAMDEKISLVVIDYIQLMDSKERFNSRHLEISHISKQINFLAKGLNIPILLISQLGKDVEKRANKEPMLSDIKESGDVRNSMDNIISIYTSTPEETKFYAKIKALKGKDTGRWTTWLEFNGNYQQFTDCPDQDALPVQDELYT